MSTLEIILTILFFVLMIPAAALVKVSCEKQYIHIDDAEVICAALFWPVTLCIVIIGYILAYLYIWIYESYCWCYRMLKKLFKI